MRIPILLFLFSLFYCSNLFSQTRTTQHHAQANINCKECHFCDIPTNKNPCLNLFPDFKREGVTIFDSAKDVPDLITIDTMSNIYEPTIFTHKLHAEMAAMSGGCASCHHFNPPGKILRCVDCHEPGLRRDLSKPGLKGAYHRQCLNCHREWSHSTNCIVCHSLKGSQNIPDKSEYLGKSHAPMIVPGKLVFQTDDDLAIVTFYHDEHNNLFGASCADCHKNESCSRCHDEHIQSKVSDKDAHDNCIACHSNEIDNNCSKCHDTTEKLRFNHKQIGWALNRFHKPLSCQACHTQNKFTKLGKSCLSCHKTWKDNEFEHSVTGLKLDENHIDNSCTDCHIEMNFVKKPYCNDCHDDYSYPAQKPGSIIKFSRK